ncbi:sugar phosphate isomerase/epimerase [Thioclava sp. BHET1]|uniref:Xylose isomerase n=1 Tax=Thioclava dalianensis TaxID=1185766 RepID=A0A074TK45_9RHOB|nr:sugar phosphate isomerase/epimerase [Thioclava dalianensis]KEP70545.1 xylose isomerase [Thioclava dalianensis]TMV90655.1 sugar phosphate isomerase/epimerase [Thioclava sp. BHET1]
MTDFNYQLYSSRNFGPLEDTLGMLAAAGYTGVEGFGGLYESSSDSELSAFRRQLDAVGLTMPSGHFSLALVEDTPERAIEIARTLGMTSLFVPFLMPDDRPSDAGGWAAFGARLARAGAPLREAGFGFGWHNHDFEFKPLADGSVPMTHLLEAAPDLAWEADIAWIARGGADPFEWIDRYGAQMHAAHVKDIAPEGEKADEDGWSDVGLGVLPWDRLLPALRKADVTHFVMEHDNPSDDARFARVSIDNARKL